MSIDIVFEKFSMMHSKSDEDLGKAEDVTKYVELESSTIRNIDDKKQFKTPYETNHDL